MGPIGRSCTSWLVDTAAVAMTRERGPVDNGMCAVLETTPATRCGELVAFVR